MNLKYFGLVEGMIPDPMHALFLGVVSQHTTILLTSPNDEYYIGSPSKVTIINKRLQNFKPPKCLTRTPRGIDPYNLWKASEWRSWILWYALPCLRDLIPKKFITHLALLVTAINILLQKSISISDINRAEALLMKFSVNMQKYYGKISITYNMHLLSHLTKAVKDWGPLWINNCFEFEDENRILLLSKKSPKEVALQLANKFLFKKSLKKFAETFSTNAAVTEFCESIYRNRLKFYTQLGNCVLMGSGEYYELSTSEKACLNVPQVEDCKIYDRMIYKRIRYTSISYDKCTKTSDHFFENKNGDVGCIQKIVLIRINNEDKVIVFYNTIRLYSNFLETRHVVVDHIRKCSKPFVLSPVIQYCEPSYIRRPCIFLPTEKENFMSFVPQGCLGD